MTAECRESCPCKARDSRDAIERSARLIGLDVRAAESLIATLSAHGWAVSKRNGATS